MLITEEELRRSAGGEMRDDDGSADSAAELVAMDIVGHGSEVRSGVEVAIAQELECVAMELAAAGLGDDIDHRARALAIFGVVVAGLNAELLQGIREWERAIDVGHFIHVVAAVKEEILLIGKGTVRAGDYGSGKGLPIALVNAVSLVGGVDHTGNQCYQRGCISAIERQIDDARLIDDLRERARGGIDLGRIADYADGHG